jgi:hypothetical protein
MGCGETLFLGDGGYVICSYLHCPEPDAVSTLLGDREWRHVVTFTDDGFTVRHPLRERLRDELETCDLHEYCAGLPGPPVKPGRYFAESPPFEPASWQFVEVPS